MRAGYGRTHSLNGAESKIEMNVAFNLARTLVEIGFHEAQIECVFVGAGFGRDHGIVDTNAQHLRVDASQGALIAAARCRVGLGCAAVA